MKVILFKRLAAHWVSRALDEQGTVYIERETVVALGFLQSL